MKYSVFAAATLAATVLAGGSYAEDAPVTDYMNYDFSIGAIVLGRTSSQVVVLDDFGTPYLTSGGALWPSAGLDAKFSRDLSNGFSLGGRIIATAAIATNRSNAVPIFGGLAFTDVTSGFGLFGPASFVGSVDQYSNFTSVEANVGHQSGNMPVRFYTGLRYVHIGDGLDAVISTGDLGGASNRYKIDAANDMFGAQIGIRLDAPVSSDKWSGYATASVGYYGNSGNVMAGTSGLVLGTSAPGPISTSDSATSRFGTFGADLHIAGAYKLAANKRLEFGYSLMYFDRVASAAPSYGVSNSGTPTAAVATSSALFHGLSASFKLSF